MSPVVWWIAMALVAIAVLDILIVNSDGLYVVADRTILALLAPVFPGLRASLAMSRMRRMLKRCARDTAVNFARRLGQEKVLLQVAEEEAPVAEAARYARDLGLGSDAERLWAAAVDEELKAGREPTAVALAMEAGLTAWLAGHCESEGNLRAAGEHWQKLARPLDAARCFEAAGDWYRAAQELCRAGLRAEVESLLIRCRDPHATTYARNWLLHNDPGAPA